MTRASPQHASLVGHQPQDPDFAAVVRASFARQGFLATMGARLMLVEPGRTRIELPFTPQLAQQVGLFHGGAIGAVADSAGGYAALTLLPAGSEVVSVEYKINFTRPALGTLLRADAEVIRSGRSVSVCRSDVHVIDGDFVHLCAVMQATFMRTGA